jgi:LmbE family N-acetylglucosaminyl deacetylase
MLSLSVDAGKLRSILCLGAHCDDIEIGCGASIRRLVQENPDVHVTCVTLSSDPERENESRRAVDVLLGEAAHKTVKIEDFKENYFPYIGSDLKDYMQDLRDSVSPDLIFTHFRNDAHQDHRLVSELTSNAFRNNFILEYEIPKYDGDLGTPNFFITLKHDQCRHKVDAIYDCFTSQRERSWFSKETFWATLRLRGIESNAASGYAEGFYARKCVY